MFVHLYSTAILFEYCKTLVIRGLTNALTRWPRKPIFHLHKILLKQIVGTKGLRTMDMLQVLQLWHPGLSFYNIILVFS